MSTQTQPVRVFAEPDYCYGVGPLRLRIERVDWANPVWYDDETWYHVEGVEVGRTGTDRGRRQVLVRGRRLPRPPPRGIDQGLRATPAQ